MKEKLLSYFTARNEERERQYLKLAYNCAFENSIDPSTKTGAVLVLNKNLVGIKWNHLPLEIQNAYSSEELKEKLLNRDWKMRYMIHAESASIVDARIKQNNFKGATMYMPWAPCVPCAKKILNEGISSYVSHKAMLEKSPERWDESLMEALTLLKNANVNLFMYYEKIGEDTKGFFSGEVWYP
jgi:dCMP deaminase